MSLQQKKYFTDNFSVNCVFVNSVGNNNNYNGWNNCRTAQTNKGEFRRMTVRGKCVHIFILLFSISTLMVIFDILIY